MSIFLRNIVLHLGACLRTTVLFFASTIILLPLAAQGENDGRTRIVIETTLGNIKVVLYDETPLHSKNFQVVGEQRVL